MPGADRRETRVANLVLLLVTACWGLTFPAIHVAVAEIDPHVFLALRMGLAFLGLVILFRNRFLTGWKGRLSKGVVLGVFLYGSYAFQAVGLRYTTASRSGFITGLSVALVPFLYALIRRKPPGLLPVTGAFLSLVGLFFLTRPDAGGLNAGDILTFGTAITYAIYVVLLESYTVSESPEPYVGIQTATVALASLAFVPFSDRHVEWTGGLAIALLITVPVAVFSFIAITKYQPKTQATRAAVIYALEPVFASFFSALWLHERLGGSGFIGAAIMLVGFVLAVWPEKRRPVLPETPATD